MCICMHMYMCVHVCVYMCMCICVYMYVCMSVYMYTYALIYTRVCVYTCTRVGAFCLFLLSNCSVWRRPYRYATLALVWGTEITIWLFPYLRPMLKVAYRSGCLHKNLQGREKLRVRFCAPINVQPSGQNSPTNFPSREGRRGNRHMARSVRIIRTEVPRVPRNRIFVETPLPVCYFDISSRWGNNHMMMIAFITIKSSLVPLIEGLCAQIYFRFEISVVCSYLLLFFFVNEKTC